MKNAYLIPILILLAGFTVAIYFGMQSDWDGDQFKVDRLTNITPAPATNITGSPSGTPQLNDAELKQRLNEFLRQQKAQEPQIITDNPQLPQDPTEEQIDAYLSEIEKRAVATTTIAIKDCVPDPIVAKASVSGSVTFVNNSDKEISMLISDQRFSVPPSGTKELSIKFASGTGVYNFDCDAYYSVGTVWTY